MADYIYVMREHNPFGFRTFKHKVGISNKPLRRRGGMQTGNADDLIIVGVVKVRGRSRTERVEDRVHSWLSPLHIRGEWFWFLPFPDFLLPAIVRLAKFLTF